MVCPICRKGYVVYEYGYTEKGKHWIGRNWITKDQNRALENVKGRITTAAQKTLARTEREHMERWMALCQPPANKKQLWTLLTDGGNSYSPSLSTFYKHVQRVGLERHWRQQFSIPHMRRIIEVLDIEDEELQAALDRIDTMHGEQATLEAEYRRSGFS